MCYMFLLYTELCQSIIPLNFSFKSACESPVTTLYIDSSKRLKRTSLCQCTLREREMPITKLYCIILGINLKAHDFRFCKMPNSSSKPQIKSFLHVCSLFNYSLNSSRIKSKVNRTASFTLDNFLS
jgi:hypothetical protein